MAPENKTRILIVDDNKGIHEDLKQVLGLNKSAEPDKETLELESELFGNSNHEDNVYFSAMDYQIDDAYQGNEALEMVEIAELEGNPYVLIFMDVRMPPGMDGIQTISKIWEKYPQIEMVICTAYSDYTWDQLIDSLGVNDNLMFMKKPFDSITVRQLAITAIEKWQKNKKTIKNIDLLESKIDERSADLKSMMLHLDKLKEGTTDDVILKDEMLLCLNKQIKGPLSGIMGMTDMLLDTDLNEDQIALADTIRTSGDALHMLIDDIVDYADIETGGRQIEEVEFNVRRTVENIADLISMSAEKKGIEVAAVIHADIPEILIGDSMRLHQILFNFATNAVKFTQEGEIVISVQCDLSSNKERFKDNKSNQIKLLFEVTDTGIGISKENRQKLFAPFNKVAESGGNGSQGTGLGLSVSKQLAGLINGKVGVESSERIGSTFWLRVGFKIADLPDYQFFPRSETVNGLKCLIVGDNPTSMKILSLYISQWGAECSETTDEMLALENLDTAVDIKPFDVVIAEFKNNAVERLIKFAETIKQYKKFNHLRLMCLTDKKKKGNTEILKKHGYSGYLTKPIKHSHLYNTLLMIKGINEKQERAGELITKHVIDKIAPDRYLVLVAEDNKTNQVTIARLLNKLKIRCDVVNNGQEALYAFQKKKYDLIFMDCRMPVMDGYESVKKIREIERKSTFAKTLESITDKRNLPKDFKKPFNEKNIPIIAITADAYAENKDRCIATGMNDIMTKPVIFDQMVEILKNYLKND